MSDILREIAAHARERVFADAEINSLDVVRELALQGGAANGKAFRDALKKPGLSFICEVKRASPSKGLIAKTFPYVEIAKEYESAGADAVLLICALLDTDTLRRYLSVCADLGLAALVEAHDEREIMSAVSAGAEIIGVNNRNLKDFSVDFSNAARLRDKIPPDCVYVAESGVHSPADVSALRRIGADAVLIGEALMKSGNKGKFLADMRRAAQ